MSYFQTLQTIINTPEYKATGWWDETLATTPQLIVFKTLKLTDGYHHGFRNLQVPKDIALLVGLALDRGCFPDVTRPYTYASYINQHNYKFVFYDLRGELLCVEPNGATYANIT